MGDIHINGKLLSRSWADQHPINWQFELQKAYIDKVKPLCLCHGHAKPLTMHITKAGDTSVVSQRSSEESELI